MTAAKVHRYLYLGEVGGTQPNGAFKTRTLAAYTPTEVTYRVLR